MSLALLPTWVMLSLTACSIGSDQSPRDIDRLAAGDQIPPSPRGGAAAIGSGRIFLLAPDVPGLPTRLHAVARDVPDDAAEVMQALFDGPNTAESANQYRTALPTGIRLLSVGLRAGGVLSLDISDEIQALSGEVLIAAIAQLMYTASGLNGVKSVSITVDGAVTRWPAANGELQSAPLTVYDYPGWDTSSQPAYPGTPPTP
jgi:hypothetical protein